MFDSGGARTSKGLAMIDPRQYCLKEAMRARHNDKLAMTFESDLYLFVAALQFLCAPSAPVLWHRVQVGMG